MTYSSVLLKGIQGYLPAKPLAILLLLHSYVQLQWQCISRGGRGWLAFDNRKIIPQSFRSAHIANVCDKTKQDDFRWKLYESMITFVESSMKPRWLSLKALQNQDDFRWKLYESRMTYIESSTKAGSGWLLLKALRKQDQDDFSDQDAKF